MKQTKVFIARDRNGELYFYQDEPKMREDGTFIGTGFVSECKAFNDIKCGECKEGVITFKNE